MVSSTASTEALAAALVAPVASATESTNSALFMSRTSLDLVAREITEA